MPLENLNVHTYKHTTIGHIQRPKTTSWKRIVCSAHTGFLVCYNSTTTCLWRRAWLREMVIDAELQHLEFQFKMTRWTLKGCCYNESPCDVYRSEVTISMGSYLKRSICPSDKELIAHMDELVAWASLEPSRAKNEDILNQMMYLAQGVFVIQMSPMMTKSSRQRKGNRS